MKRDIAVSSPRRIGAALAVGIAIAAVFTAGRVLAPDPVVDNLGQGCRGTVPVAAAGVYLETDAITVTEEVPEDFGDLTASVTASPTEETREAASEVDALQCDIVPAAITSPADAQAELDVVISPTEYADGYHASGLVTTDETVPFGSGWVGNYSPSDSYSLLGTATLLLECPAQPGDGLMVEVTGSWTEDDHDLVRQKHEQLAVVTARLARAAGQEWGCPDQPGGIPDSLPLDGVTATSPAKADGICRGVVDAELASILGVETVTDAPAGLALTEQCEVHGAVDEENESYYLTAHYGPLQGTGEAAHLATTATCGRGQGRAYYTATESTETGGLLPNESADNEDALQEMFAEFVRSSAERHGCELDDPEDLEQADSFGPDETEALRLAQHLAEPDPADAALPATEETVLAILDDLEAIAGQWVTTGPRTHTGDSPNCAEVPGLCDELRAGGAVGFTDSQDRRTGFEVLVFDDEEAAQTALDAVKTWVEQFEQGGIDDYDDPGLEHFGEDGQSTVARTETALKTYRTYTLQGPYLGIAEYASTQSTGAMWDTMRQLTPHLSQRMNEAEAGQQPTSTDPYTE